MAEVLPLTSQKIFENSNLLTALLQPLD
jgi:hypothetical protein